MTMEVQVRELGELKVVGFDGKYTFETMSEIPKLWDEHYLPRQHEIAQWDGKQSLGVCIDCPAEQRFHYLAGAVVSEINDVPSGMTTMTIPPQTYAVVTLKGDPLNKIGAAFEHIHKEWLPTSGYQLAENGVSFELYDARFTVDSDCDNAELDVYVAVK